MIEISVPGVGVFSLHHLVLDYNGTLARDGVLLPGVGDIVRMLARDWLFMWSRAIRSAARPLRFPDIHAN
ncbi:MAG: hypothetical protein WBX25_30030 [Rhodomicrobium sp.]